MQTLALFLGLYALTFVIFAVANGDFAKRLIRWLTAFDILVFSLVTFGMAKRNETISAVSWVLEVDGRWQGRVARPVIDWMLSPLEKNHCYVSWLAERNKY